MPVTPHQPLAKENNYADSYTRCDNGVVAKNTILYDGDGNIIASLGGGSGGDGAIVDGISSAIKATVLDYTSSNPLAVRLTDTNGDFTSNFDVRSQVIIPSGTAGALNADAVASTDVSKYSWFSVQITGPYSGTMSWQGSNDGSTWAAMNAFPIGTASGGPANSTTSVGIWHGPLSVRYLRVRMTSYTSGSAVVTVLVNAMPNFNYHTSANIANNVGISSVTPGTTAALLGKAEDAVAASGDTGVAVWGVRRDTPATNTSAAGDYAEHGISGQGGLWVTPTPSIGGGWSVSSQTALSNTKTQVVAVASTFGGYMFYNPNASAVYIQVWDVANASITVGTTAPTYVIPLPAGAAANVEFSNGIKHATAINIAATTTPTGSTAPGTALTGFVLYK